MLKLPLKAGVCVHLYVCMCTVFSQGLTQATTELATPQPLSDFLPEYFPGVCAFGGVAVVGDGLCHKGPSSKWQNYQITWHYKTVHRKQAIWQAEELWVLKGDIGQQHNNTSIMFQIWKCYHQPKYPLCSRSEYRWHFNTCKRPLNFYSENFRRIWQIKTKTLNKKGRQYRVSELRTQHRKGIRWL